MPAVIEGSSLTKSYAGARQPAVDAIDFEVAEGECFGFLGPNGAGKTTTMRMISCRAERSGGDLSVLGLDPSRDERAIKRGIGVVPQETNLDTVLTVMENLVSYGRYYDLPRAECVSRAGEQLEFVSLADRADWNIDALSGGMKRRLLIARALMNEPRLLVLDEPTTGLDPQARHHVWERLRALKRKGVTLVVTTHYMEEAAHLCDRLVIMHQGRILVSGSPAALVAEHVAPEVVELTAPSLAELTHLAAAVEAHATYSDIAGDRLVVHTDNAEAVLKTAGSSGLDYDTAVERPASLEDVFLKLTGRTLDE